MLLLVPAMATMAPVMVPASRRHDDRDRDVDDLRRIAAANDDDFTARTLVADGAFRARLIDLALHRLRPGRLARLAVAVASWRARVALAAPLVA
jgi:hypothetical protein